jgi:hypothetical protein
MDPGKFAAAWPPSLGSLMISALTPHKPDRSWQGLRPGQAFGTQADDRHLPDPRGSRWGAPLKANARLVCHEIRARLGPI